MIIYNKNAGDEFKQIDKLHELLGVAMSDLSVCERAGYHIDMSQWVTTTSELPLQDAPANTCYICLAGAVMMETLDIARAGDNPKPCAYPDHLEDEAIVTRLHAINSLRIGDISGAFIAMHAGREKPSMVLRSQAWMIGKWVKPKYAPVEYCFDKPGFWRYLRDLRATLEYWDI